MARRRGPSTIACGDGPPPHRFATGRIESALHFKATKAPHARIETVSFVALTDRASAFKATKDTDRQCDTVSFVALSKDAKINLVKERDCKLAQ